MPALPIRCIAIAVVLVACSSLAKPWYSAVQDAAAPISDQAFEAKAEFEEGLRAAAAKYDARVKKLRQEYAKDLERARKDAVAASDLEEAQRILVVETRVRAESDAPSLPPHGFSVIAARWGAGSQWADVTTQIRDRITDSVLKVVPQYANLPDPKFGTNKSLVVVYSVNGGVQVALIGHDELLVLPSR